MDLTNLLSRYGNISKQAFYARVRALEMILEKDIGGKIDASPEQVELLDELDEHLKKGGSLKSFSLPTEPVPAVPMLEDDFAPFKEEREEDREYVGIARLLEIVAEKEASKRSPLWHHRELNDAAKEGWLLTTKEVKEIIGVKPVCKKGSDVFIRGCWQFTKAGKIGGAIAWLVEKV